MNASTDDVREAALDTKIAAALSNNNVQRACLLIGIPVSDAFLARQIQRPGIGGVFLRTDGAGRTAFIPVGNSPATQFGHTAIVIQRTPYLGIRQLLALARHGVRQLIYLEQRQQLLRSQTIARRMIAEMTASALSRLSNRLRNSPLNTAIEKTQARAIRQLCLGDVAIQSDWARSGPVMHLTGGLGSGGSERQLMLTVLGLQSSMDRKIRVLCQHRIEGVLAFFAHPLRHANVPVDDDILADFSSSPDDSRLIETINRAFPRESEFADTICAFARSILRHRPSVVHCWLDPINVAGGIAAALCGVPRIVLGCRSVAPIHFGLYERNMWAGYRELLKLPHVTMLNNSKAGASSYAGWLGIDRDRIEVIQNAVDPNFMSQADPSAVKDFRARFDIGNGPVIGMLGRMSEEKRPLFWLDIARDILRKRPDAKFLWAGDGPMRQTMTDRAKQYGISGHLILPGTMNDAAIALSAMTNLLLSSRMEGLPNVLLEAQSFGIPVVAAAVGGAPETLNEGVTGRAVSGSSPQDFADAVLSFVNDPAALARAKSAGPQFIKERFSVERMIRQTMSAYLP